MLAMLDENREGTHVDDHSVLIGEASVESKKGSFPRRLAARALLLAGTAFVWNYPQTQRAEAYSVASVDLDDLTRLKRGLREINYLLDNWETKTTYCNFGELQSGLLEKENKEKLLDAAKKYGILDYDKSETMNVKCKQDPEMVRAFVGLTNENLTLKYAEKLMKKPSTLNLLPDSVDSEEYIAAVDKFVSGVAAVDAIGYSARTDYSSTETKFKDDDRNSLRSSDKKDYLAQSKDEVIKVRDSLSSVVDMLNL